MNISEILLKMELYSINYRIYYNWHFYISVMYSVNGIEMYVGFIILEQFMDFYL